MKERLDKELHKRGLSKSRTHSQALIENGDVLMNGKIILKANTDVLPTDTLTLLKTSPFVSRGGEKLEHAIKTWNISLKDSVILDVGSSTGGFTDCSLKSGARHVYAIDVGTDQFDSELKKNPHITLFEKTDIRTVSSLPEPIDIAVIDVSFISLSHVIPTVVSLLKPHGTIIALIKPQFEIGPHIHKTKGIVKNEDLHIKVVTEVTSTFEKNGCEVLGVIESPILGGKGNKEFLLLSKKTL
ncbi:MAG TPA: TlyA family RNA methyltransferase [Candidatus Paceibacterota bacterium]|nr:TlyA family RNA methyltransferase [Candidatus Paceibacterota bacterium]